MRGQTCFALLLGSSFCHASILNGSFQDGIGSTADFWTFAGPAIGAATDNGYIIGAGATGASPYGGRFLSFNGGDASATNSAVQTFATTTGQQYRLTFAFANFGSSVLQQLNVTLQDGNDLSVLAQDVFQDTTGGTALNSIWSDGSVLFTAESSSTTLTFADTGSQTNSSDLLLDQVAAEPVPEPATLVLLGTGLAALARRRVRS